MGHLVEHQPGVLVDDEGVGVGGRVLGRVQEWEAGGDGLGFEVELEEDAELGQFRGVG